RAVDHAELVDATGVEPGHGEVAPAVVDGDLLGEVHAARGRLPGEVEIEVVGLHVVVGDLGGQVEAVARSDVDEVDVEHVARDVGPDEVAAGVPRPQAGRRRAQHPPAQRD